MSLCKKQAEPSNLLTWTEDSNPNSPRLAMRPNLYKHQVQDQVAESWAGPGQLGYA